MMSVISGHVKNNEISAILDVKIIQDGVPDITCTSRIVYTYYIVHIYVVGGNPY